jgi:hypothetical protein
LWRSGIQSLADEGIQHLDHTLRKSPAALRAARMGASRRIRLTQHITAKWKCLMFEILSQLPDPNESRAESLATHGWECLTLPHEHDQLRSISLIRHIHSDETLVRLWESLLLKPVCRLDAEGRWQALTRIAGLSRVASLVWTLPPRSLATGAAGDMEVWLQRPGRTLLGPVVWRNGPREMELAMQWMLADTGGRDP